jgi:hypothetical protein
MVQETVEYCPLAQLAEQEAVNFKVAGSSPAGAAVNRLISDAQDEMRVAGKVASFCAAMWLYSQRLATAPR